MPDINIEKACFIAVKAREFDAKVAVDDPDSGSNPSDDRQIDVLENRRSDPVLEELRGAIQALNEDESRDIIALAWIGRGDYAAGQWNEACAQANSIPFGDRPRYLVGTPMLADYLEQGLAEFGLSCEEVEIGRM